MKCHREASKSRTFHRLQTMRSLLSASCIQNIYNGCCRLYDACLAATNVMTKGSASGCMRPASPKPFTGCIPCVPCFPHPAYSAHTMDAAEYTSDKRKISTPYQF